MSNLYMVSQQVLVVGYDEVSGMVIAAENEAAARRIAQENCGDEGGAWGDPNFWLNPEKTDCELIGTSDRSGLILRASRNG